MARGTFLRRHARVASFLGVLLVTSSLVLLLFQEARAVTMDFTVSPPSVTTGSQATFRVDLVVPNNQIIPVQQVAAVVERQAASQTAAGVDGKVGAVVVENARCPVALTLGAPANCPDNAPLQVVDGISGPIARIRFMGFFASATGYSVASGYDQPCPCQITATGYGYDTATPSFLQGVGYGYGYNIGNVGAAFTELAGRGYGYVEDLILRFEVDVSGASLSTARHYLTVIVMTGSAVIGDVSSPFTEFQVLGGGGGGGGGAPTVGVTPIITIVDGVATATATLTNIAAGTTVTIPLTGMGFGLTELTLNTALAIPSANVIVKASTTPLPGSAALGTDWGPVVFLDISVTGAPAGAITGGTLKFSLTAAQLTGKNAMHVVLVHLAGKVLALPTKPLTTNPDGSATFEAQLPSFSPFAIVFDQAAPTISNLRPPDGAGATTRPLIAASIGDNRGINTAVTRMLVDGQAVAATVTQTEILYTPPVALTLGNHTVRVEATDLSGFATNTTWSFNALAAADTSPPTITIVSPAKDGFTNNPRPLIRADYADNIGIDTTKVTVSLDGAPAPAPVITATSLSFTPAVGLTDGRHTVTVTVTDTSGNANFSTWTFTVDTVMPLIGAVEPPDGATVSQARPAIKASYSDALSGIDTGKVRLLLDGAPVGAAPTGSAVSFTPAKDLSQGKHTAALEVADLAGNTAGKTWTFTVELKEVFPWLIVIVLVILLAVAVGGYYWYTKMRAKPGAPPGGPPGGSPPG